MHKILIAGSLSFQELYCLQTSLDYLQKCCIDDPNIEKSLELIVENITISRFIGYMFNNINEIEPETQKSVQLLIAKKMTTKNKSINEMSLSTGISHSKLGRICNLSNPVNVDAHAALKILSALNATVDELFACLVLLFPELKLFTSS